MFSLSFVYDHITINQRAIQQNIAMCQCRRVFLQNIIIAAHTPPISVRKPPTKRFNGQTTAGNEDLQTFLTRTKLSTIDNGPLPCLKDVVGLENAKEVLREATMLPEQFPELFKLRRAWKTILLYGPPGNGKTYISKAISAESKSQFFALTAGDLMIAFAENCEKVVKDLFSAARRSGKVVVCFDDVDMLFSVEGSCETEGLKRVKGEILKELQKLQECVSDVVFIATSRTPWLLEEAFLRRMDKRVHVGLPNAKNRTKMLEKMLRNVSHTLSLEDIENIAMECETYSGSDMKALVMDAEMEPLRVIQRSTHFREISEEKDGKRIQLKSPCSYDDFGAIEGRFTDMERNMLHIPPVSCLDFELALDRTKPTVGMETAEEHLKFTKKKGQD